MTSLAEYASQRHETIIALQDERQLRRNLIEELGLLAESLQANSFDSPSSGEVMLHHCLPHSTIGDGGGDGKRDEAQRVSLGTIATAINSFQRASKAISASERKAKEVLNNHTLALERIFQLEEELKHTKTMLVETERSKSQLRGRLSVLESNTKYMEEVQSKMTSELAGMRQKTIKVRRDKSILANELRLVRGNRTSTSQQSMALGTTSKGEKDTIPLETNTPSGDCVKVPDYHHHGRRKHKHVIIETTGEEFQYDASAFRSLVRERLRHRICCSVIVNGSSAEAMLGNNLVNDVTNDDTTTNKSRCLVSSPPLIKACDLELAPGIHGEESEGSISYELTFVTEQIGLQFAITEDKKVVISGRKGFIHQFSVRPRLGAVLVACNGKNVIGDTSKEISLVLKVAGRPLRLQFIEEHQP